MRHVSTLNAFQAHTQSQSKRRPSTHTHKHSQDTHVVLSSFISRHKSLYVPATLVQDSKRANDRYQNRMRTNCRPLSARATHFNGKYFSIVNWIVTGKMYVGINSDILCVSLSSLFLSPWLPISLRPPALRCGALWPAFSTCSMCDHFAFLFRRNEWTNECVSSRARARNSHFLSIACLIAYSNHIRSAYYTNVECLCLW